MKINPAIIYFLGIMNVFTYCIKPPEVTDPCVIQHDSVAIASKLLDLSGAEKIMGEPGKLTCNTFIKKGDTLEYKCDYTAISTDKNTNKTGKLYFMYEIYASEADAKKAYDFIYQGNRLHEGVQVMEGLGDEAYYHSDGTNFYFYLVRKQQKMFRMKLNKVTSHSSESEFKNVTRLITDKI